MKLEKLVIQNFQSISEATVFLRDRGLVSIRGEMKDDAGSLSNGAGKSTLINAILWCNYGDAGKKLGSVDDVVRDGSKGGCSVQCVWYDDIHDKRYLVTRYRKHPTYKNSLLVQLESEDGLVDHSKGTDKETQLVVNKLLGGDQMTFEASCIAQQEKAPDLPGMTDTELKALLENVLPFESLKEDHKKAFLELTKKKEELSYIDRAIDSCEYRIGFIEKQIQEAKDAIDGWEAKVEDRDYILQNKLEELKDEISDIQDKLKPQDKIEEAIAKYTKLRDAYDPRLRSKAEMELAIAKQDYIRIQNEIKNHKTDCQSCGKPLDNAEDHLEGLKAKAQRIAENGAIKRKAFEATDADDAAYRENLIKLQKLGELKISQDGLRGRLSLYEKAADNLATELASKPENPHTALLEGHKSVLADELFTRERLKGDIERLKAEVAVLEAVVETLSPKGVRYFMLETVTPELTNKTNYYLSQLADGALTATWSTVTKLKSGEYREKFSIDVSKFGKKGYGRLSGGEKRKVKLACFFALQDLIAARASKSIDLWCGDEIDHALDAAGIERLMALLYDKVKTKHTILVVSHNELRDWIPNSTTVVMEDGVSTVTGDLVNEC